MSKFEVSLCAVLVASCSSTKSTTPAGEPCSPSSEAGSAFDATAAPDSSDVTGCSVPGALVSYLRTTTSDTSDTRWDSESWGAADIESALLAAVDAARAPIFFAQPQNDVHTEPTVVYSGRAGTDGLMYQATIYPPVPNASSPADAHSRFVSDAPEVAQWASGALDFLRRYGM
jgi:hypothetical protein